MAGGPPAFNDDKERVRSASDIVRVIGEAVALKPHGREYVGLCPFHDDHKPSMNVVPAKQIFHCFVCQTGGDVFSFVQKKWNMDFREALEFLADRAGIELTPWRASEPSGSADADGGGAGGRASGRRGPSSRSAMLEATRVAAEFYRAVLAHPQHGKAARDMIERRGIAPAMVEAFGLGAAPDRRDGLVLKVQSRGLDPAAFVDAGLLKRRESDGGLFDLVHNRLIFPIRDQLGRVIAFGGRRLNEADKTKYLNSPETRLFDKSATLYGLDRAGKSIQRERTAIIVEGYTDTIACHQAGVENVVATLGTALTPGHAAALRRVCDTVVLLFDGDAAGQKAADKAVEVFLVESIDVRIATLARFTDAKDPDELLKREGGREVFGRAIAGAVELLEYRYARVRERVGGAGPAAMERATGEELDQLGRLGVGRATPMRRQFILRRLHEITGLPAAMLAGAMPVGRAAGGGRSVSANSAGASAAADAPGAEAAPEETGVLGPRLTHHEYLLGCLLCDPSLWHTLTDEDRALVAPGRFGSPPVARVARVLVEVVSAGGGGAQPREEDAASAGGPTFSHLLAAMGEDESGKSVAVALLSRLSEQSQRQAEVLRRACAEVVARLRARARAESGDQAAIGAAIAAAGGRPDVLPRPRAGG